MSSDKWNEQYLNHYDYTLFKSKYKIDGKLSKDKSENFENIIKLLEVESNDTSMFRNLLELLMKYLNNGHVMYYCGGNICCRYVNYAITKEIRKKNYVHYTDSKFDTFKKFMNKYLYVTASHNCENTLDYINPDILSRMNILYDLYDMYNELISLKSNDENNKLCTALSLLVMNYKEAIKRHEGDEKFIKQLENYRNLILSKKPNYQSTCGWNLTSITLPNPVNSHEDEIQKVQEKQLNSDVPTQLTNNELEKSKTIVSATGESELSGQSGLQQQSPSAHPHSVQPQLDHSETTKSHYVQLKREEPESDELHLIQSPSIEHPQNEWHEREVMEPIDQKTYTLKYPTNAPEHTDGVLGKMQGFFTETLGQVEPAPILVVSGGMGALFLLFKYTPVGSFFGGRRRRIHQIPSSFRGFPPGEFPIFHEYEGGNIGYGPMNINPLAE